MQQRKRLDARSYRQFFESLPKKCKVDPTCGKTSPDDGGNRPEVKSGPGNEELTIKKSSDGIQVHSSNDADEKQRSGGENKDKAGGESKGGMAKETSKCTLSSPDDGNNSLEVKSGPGNEELTCKKSGDGTQVHSDNHEKHGSNAESKDEAGGESKSGMSKETSECKSSSPRLSEYWVPVGFSCLQLEKYCEILVKNSGLLCSSKNKKGNVELLHDILSTIKKCCDHPYVVDPSLVTSVGEGCPVVDKLTMGIEGSGKLQLLEKFLQGVREKQLRGVIVFRSNSNSLRYILDDFVCRRFGNDSYIHIYREVDNSKRRAALDLFNDKSSGRFLLLMEKSSCQSSIRLSSVDFVLLYNSDWNLVNDMKALQNMSIQAELDHVKVFRLYSVDSVEEKVLSLATKGVLLETSIARFNFNRSHTLLQWGASHLFSRLGDYHSSPSLDNPNNSALQKLQHDVLHELSVLLSLQEGDSCHRSCVAKVPGTNDFSGMSLYGMQDVLRIDEDIPPCAIWISLLEGKNPQWKLLPGSSGRVKRRSKSGSKDHLVMGKSMVHCRHESLPLSPKVRKAHTPSFRRKSRTFAGRPNSGGIGVHLLSFRGFSDSFTAARRTKKLVLNQKRYIHGFLRARRVERKKLETEHQSKLALIDERFGERAAKQHMLKELDGIYKAKIKEFDREMDMKLKKLVDRQRAARKWLNHSRADSEGPISAPRYESISNSELLQVVEPVEKPVPSLVPASDPECQPDSRGGKRIEHDTVEKEILPEESNGENESNDVAQNDPILQTVNRVSQSTSNCREPPQDVQHVSDMEIEGVESTNMEPLEDTVPGESVQLNTQATGSLSQSVESQGDNSVMLSSDKAPETGASNLCTLVDHERSALSGEKNNDSLANVACEELLDGGHTKEVPVRLNPSSPTLVLPVTRNEEAEGTSCMGIPSSVSVQPQACATTGNLPLFEQPVSSTALSSQDIIQNDVPLVVQSFQTVSQLHSSVVACDIPPALNLTDTTNLPPFIGYPQEISSLRRLPGLSLPTGGDPLQNELIRMRKEEEEAVRVHMDKVKDFESNYQREMEEIRKKYELLVMEAEKALQQKKEDIGSYYKKVWANQMLAEAMLLFNLDRVQEECSSTPIQQQNPAMQQQQLSQHSLIDPLHVTGYPPVGHHLPWGPTGYPVASFPTAHTGTRPSMYGVQSQQARVPCYGSVVGSYTMDRNVGPVMPREGCQESPIQL